MDMVILTIKFNQFCLKFLADFRKYDKKNIQGVFGKYFTPVFGNKDQMHVKIKNAMSTISN